MGARFAKHNNTLTSQRADNEYKWSDRISTLIALIYSDVLSICSKFIFLCITMGFHSDTTAGYSLRILGLNTHSYQSARDG
jgi:ABC-type uncharacterized transport system permease subunit